MVVPERVNKTLKGVFEATNKLGKKGGFGREGEKFFDFFNREKFVVKNSKFKLGQFFFLVDFVDFFERSDFVVKTVGDGGGSGQFFREFDFETLEGAGNKGVFDNLHLATGLFDVVTEGGDISSA